MAGVAKTETECTAECLGSDHLVSGGKESCAPQRPRAGRGRYASLRGPPLVYVC